MHICFFHKYDSLFSPPCFFLLEVTQQTFQRCFNVVFWLIRRRDLGQRQFNVETTLYISMLEFATWNNVESMLCISALIRTTLDNVEITLSFSTSSYNVGKRRNNVVKMTISKKSKTNHFK